MTKQKFSSAWNSYVIKNHDESILKDHIKVSTTSDECSPRVTFLCGSEEVSVSATLACVAFPALRDVIKSFPHGQCSCDLLFRKESSIFISLDSDIDITMLLMLKQIVTMSLSEVKMSNHELGQLRDLMRMLGMSPSLFRLEDLSPEEVCMSQDRTMPFKEEVPETRHTTLDEVTEVEALNIKEKEDKIRECC